MVPGTAAPGSPPQQATRESPCPSRPGPSIPRSARVPTGRPLQLLCSLAGVPGSPRRPRGTMWHQWAQHCSVPSAGLQRVPQPLPCVLCEWPQAGGRGRSGQPAVASCDACHGVPRQLWARGLRCLGTVEGCGCPCGGDGNLGTRGSVLEAGVGGSGGLGWGTPGVIVQPPHSSCLPISAQGGRAEARTGM